MAIQNNFPAIKPSLNLDFANTKTLDPRITFNRASTATYYDGKTVAKAEENLLRYSQEFDNAAWVKAGISVTANNEVAPDGTTTADLIVENTATGSHRVQATYNSSEILTYSFYAKAGTRTWLWVYFSDYNGGSAWFDVGNGVIGQVEFGVSATITSVGNGWYRCTLTKRNATFASSVVTAIATGSGSTNYTGDGTSGIYIWGAQLEQRSSVTAYTPTTNQPITNYVPVLQTAAANVARFDHNPVTGESLGLLIEEQRTNLLTYSEVFANAVWEKSNVAVTANAVVAPDGTLSADKVVSATETTQQYVARSPSYTAGVSYAITVYAKAGELNLVQLRFHYNAFGNGEYATFNLSTGVITQSSGSGHSISSVGNGWYRCCVVGTATATAAPVHGYVFQLTANPTGGRNPNYTGDGYSGIYIWGAQLEVGTFPTSYIKTEASQVTRSADNASMAGTNFSSWYRADEGTLFAESNRLATLPANTPLVILNGPNTNLIRIRAEGLGYHVDGFYNNSNQFSMTLGTTNRFSAVAYQLNNSVGASAGVLGSVDTSCLVPLGVSDMQIGFHSYTSNRYNGHIRKIAYYPSRLSNQNLQALTT